MIYGDGTKRDQLAVEVSSRDRGLVRISATMAIQVR